MKWFRTAVASTFALVLAVGTASAASLVLPRAGQVGIGLQGSFGSLVGGGDYGEEFGSGTGLAVRLRYRMRYERAIGLSFESHQLDARTPSNRAGAFDSLTDVPPITRDRLSMVTAGFEFYQMFDTRSRTVKMISVGVGLGQATARLSNGETQIPIAGDAVYMSAGAGIERFVYRSWAVDASTRYFAMFHDGKLNHDVQVSLGMIFYAAY